MIDEIKVWRTVRSQEEVGGRRGRLVRQAAPLRSARAACQRTVRPACSPPHVHPSPPTPPVLLQIQAGMRGNLYRKGLPGGAGGAGKPGVDPHHPDLVAFWYSGLRGLQLNEPRPGGGTTRWASLRSWPAPALRRPLRWMLARSAAVWLHNVHGIASTPLATEGSCRWHRGHAQPDGGGRRCRSAQRRRGSRRCLGCQLGAQRTATTRPPPHHRPGPPQEL